MSRAGLRRRPDTVAIEERLKNSQEWIMGAAKVETPAGQGGAVDFPWKGANDRVKYGYNLRLPETTYLQLKFLSEHEPNISIHELIMLGARKIIQERMPKYEKDTEASS